MTREGKGKKEGKKDNEVKKVQSIERALNLLEAMAEAGTPQGITALAGKAGLKASTVHRLLTTLVHRGYVTREGKGGRYRLGLKLLEIANAALVFSDVRGVVRPFLEELVEYCNETANLAVLDQTEIVYIDQVESHNYIIVKMLAQVGNRGPIHCTASGKVLLAHSDQETIDWIISSLELKKYTSETITAVGELKNELALVRENGFALDYGEMEEHVRCVAAPVFNHEGTVVASISVSGPSNRLSAYYMKNELARAVMESAALASAGLGYMKK